MTDTVMREALIEINAKLIQIREDQKAIKARLKELEHFIAQLSLGKQDKPFKQTITMS